MTGFTVTGVCCNHVRDGVPCAVGAPKVLVPDFNITMHVQKIKHCTGLTRASVG